VMLEWPMRSFTTWMSAPPARSRMHDRGPGNTDRHETAERTHQHDRRHGRHSTDTQRFIRVRQSSPDACAKRP
jgi:hypothetical protein